MRAQHAAVVAVAVAVAVAMPVANSRTLGL
jgi:hypothetical protein